MNVVAHKQPRLWSRFGGFVDEEESVFAGHTLELEQVQDAYD